MAWENRDGYRKGRGPVPAADPGEPAVLTALQGIEFPIDKRSLLARVEKDRKVEWPGHQSLDLRGAIAGLPEEYFESPQELARHICEAVRGADNEVSGR